MSHIISTIYLSDPSYECPHCGSKIDILYTSKFDSFFGDVEIGDRVSVNGMTKIVQERSECVKCRKALPLYHIAVKKGILVAVEFDKRIAKHKLEKFDLDDMAYLFGKKKREIGQIKSKHEFLKAEIETAINFLDSMPIRFVINKTELDEKKLKFYNRYIRKRFGKNATIDMKELLSKIYGE